MNKDNPLFEQFDTDFHSKAKQEADMKKSDSEKQKDVPDSGTLQWEDLSDATGFLE